VKTYRSDPENPDRDRLFVGVAEYEVATDGETLIAYGLGACVGVLLYDPAGIGGLAHAMLPRQTDDVSTSEAKFVETAVEALLRDVVTAGASIGRLEGYVTGGAEVFDLDELPSDVIEDNVAVAHEVLDRLNVPVVETAVGGDRGRTVELDANTGELRVLTAHDPNPTVLRRPDEEDQVDEGEESRREKP
jgi:chemotaxis protein CheD